MSKRVTMGGSFANLQAGQTLQMQGAWREHPKYGPQFQAFYLNLNWYNTR
ncbi:hypothetical protein NDI45_23875 [Leptolyngbya sp. GB1-A1]